MKDIFSYSYSPSALSGLLGIILTVLLFMPGTTHAQGDLDTLQVETNFPGARSYALGGATMAHAYNVSSIVLNPATLSFIREQRQVGVNTFHNWTNNMISEELDLPIARVGIHSAALRVSAITTGYETFNYQGTSPLRKPNFKRYQFTGAYSVAVTDVLSAGVLANLFYAEGLNNNTWDASFDFGILYSPLSSASYGIALRGIGPEVNYYMNRRGETNLFLQDKQQSLEISGTFYFPDFAEHKTFILSFSNEKVFSEDGLRYRGGLEILPIKQLAARAGYVYAPAHEGIRVGLGINLDWFKISYAVAPQRGFNDGAHYLSASLNF